MRDFEPVGIVSLGCPKNIVDSERLLGKLLSNKFHITFDLEEAHSVIINTCAFLKEARDEAESVIAEFLDKKEKGFIKKVIVSGCYPSLAKDKLLEKFPQIDAITGTNNLFEITEALNGKERTFVSEQFERKFAPRFPITLPHYEYLKISDGCNHSCAFCLIPKIKGKLHSFDMEFLVNEAERLVESGVKEIILIAQDTTQYGLDIYGKNKLLTLIEALEKIKNLYWIRILYTYPSEINEELVQYIASSSKVVPYIDLPIQHISDRILKRMNRTHSRSETERIIRMLKDYNIAIRTTVITGFPGETREDFEELKSFIKDVRFEHLGAFAFSKEKGTESYFMDGEVDINERIERKGEIEALQAKINAEKLKGMVGKTLPVIVDYYDDNTGFYIGRTHFDAPEIDDYALISGDVEEGQIYNALVKGSDSEKLIVEVTK